MDYKKLKKDELIKIIENLNKANSAETIRKAQEYDKLKNHINDLEHIDEMMSKIRDLEYENEELIDEKHDLENKIDDLECDLEDSVKIINEIKLGYINLIRGYTIDGLHPLKDSEFKDYILDFFYRFSK